MHVTGPDPGSMVNSARPLSAAMGTARSCRLRKPANLSVGLDRPQCPHQVAGSSKDRILRPSSAQTNFAYSPVSELTSKIL
ncbi:hypothetical protein BDV96DRAFT_587285, partial [Lophiotrema nucula]